MSFPSVISPSLLDLFAKTPALTPPNGTIPNFVDPLSRTPTLVITTSIFLGITLLFYLNRVYTKIFLIKKVTLDDGTLFLGLLGSLTYYGASIWGGQKGHLGRHEWDLSILQATSLDLLIPAYMMPVLTPLTFFFLKSTFFIFYLHLFNTLPRLRVYIWSGLVLTIVNYAIFTVLFFFFETPRKGESWIVKELSANEHKSIHMAVPFTIIGLVIDLYILMIPIIGISGLKISKNRKFGIMIIMLSGFLGCVCAAVNIFYRFLMQTSPDQSWNTTPINICTVSEMFAGIICASMPSAAKTARHHYPAYEWVFRTTSTHLASFRSSFFRTGYAGGSRYSAAAYSAQKKDGNYETDALKFTDIKYEQHFSLDYVSAVDDRPEWNTSRTTVSTEKISNAV